DRMLSPQPFFARRRTICIRSQFSPPYRSTFVRLEGVQVISGWTGDKRRSPVLLKQRAVGAFANELGDVGEGHDFADGGALVFCLRVVRAADFGADPIAEVRGFVAGAAVVVEPVAGVVGLRGEVGLETLE